VKYTKEGGDPMKVFGQYVGRFFDALKCFRQLRLPSSSEGDSAPMTDKEAEHERYAQNRRETFRDNIRALFGSTGYKIYDSSDWSNFENRVFPVVGGTNIDHLYGLYDMLREHGYHNITEIDAKHFKGIYFENSYGLPGIIISPKKEYISIDQHIFNQSRDALTVFELQAFGQKYDIKNLQKIDLASSISLWVADEMVMVDFLNIPHDILSYTKYCNNQNEYVRHYLEFKNRQKSFILKDFFSGEYDHIETFSRVYYWTIYFMALSLRDQDTPVTIHDVGTGVAQFPLMLSYLNSDELNGLDIKEIIASDVGWTGQDYVEKILTRHKDHRPIRFVNLDLVKQKQKIPYTDATVLNDVLEHLPDDKISLEALKTLWSHTRKILIVHVPFEPAPNPAWEHLITFNADKLRVWGNQLPEAKILSDNYKEDDGKLLTDHGYLIVQRID